MFNTNGEQWVLGNCNRGSTDFKFHQLILGSHPIVQDGLKRYSAKANPEIEVEKLAYFVASVIWRGGAHNWNLIRDDLPPITLGKYEGDLRAYLLGNARFPKDSVLQIGVILDPIFWHVMTFPLREYSGDFSIYRFYFLGLAFKLFLGSEIPDALKPTCAYYSADQIIFAGGAVDDDVRKSVIQTKTRAQPARKLK
jgi:hypothetical protein